jgi:hypothetical protein
VPVPLSDSKLALEDDAPATPTWQLDDV